MARSLVIMTLVALCVVAHGACTSSWSDGGWRTRAVQPVPTPAGEGLPYDADEVRLQVSFSEAVPLGRGQVIENADRLRRTRLCDTPNDIDCDGLNDFNESNPPLGPYFESSGTERAGDGYAVTRHRFAAQVGYSGDGWRSVHGRLSVAPTRWVVAGREDVARPGRAVLVSLGVGGRWELLDNVPGARRTDLSLLADAALDRHVVRSSQTLQEFDLNEQNLLSIDLGVGLQLGVNVGARTYLHGLVSATGIRSAEGFSALDPVAAIGAGVTRYREQWLASLSAVVPVTRAGDARPAPHLTLTLAHRRRGEERLLRR